MSNVPPQPISAQVKPEAKVIPDARPRIALSLARFDKRKRVDLLIRAWAAAETRGWRLIVAGSGEASEVVRAVETAAIEANATGADVRLPGFVSGEEKQRLLSESELYLSTSEYENYGMAIVEAVQSQTVPLVAGSTPWSPNLSRFGLVLDSEVRQMAQSISRFCAMSFRDLQDLSSEVASCLVFSDAPTVARKMLDEAYASSRD